MCLFTLACAGAGANYSSAPTAATQARPSAETAALQRSLFARDPGGQLTEEKLQEILGRPLELDLPARVGVLPVVAAEDWRGPGPSYEMAPAGLAIFSKTLPSDEAFTLVSEMLPIPSGALGMEALRQIAARYKLRYVVLYRENMTRKRRTNAWSLGYATLVGALFLPGTTLEVDGYVEASLFDVKTGLLLFTVRRRVHADRKSSVWHRGHKLATLQRKLATKVGSKLAADVRRALFRYRAAVEVENQRLRAHSPRAAPTSVKLAGPGPTQAAPPAPAMTRAGGLDASN